MNVVRLYVIEAVFLLVFWTILYRYIKPGLGLTIVFVILFAIMFALLEVFVAEH